MNEDTSSKRRYTVGGLNKCVLNAKHDKYPFLSSMG